MHNRKVLNITNNRLFGYRGSLGIFLILRMKYYIRRNYSTLYLWFPIDKMKTRFAYKTRHISCYQLRFLFSSYNMVIRISQLRTFTRIKNNSITLCLREVENNTTFGIIYTITKIHSPCHQHYFIIIAEQEILIDKLKCRIQYAKRLTMEFALHIIINV